MVALERVNNMDNKKIGEFIKKLRKRNNLTQEELAEMMHLSRQTISDIELCKTEPSIDKITDFSEIFNVSVLDIYSGQIVDKNDIDKTNAIINNINKNIIKSARIKGLKLTLIIIVIFILIFLLYYFFNSYNSIKVYKILGESDNFYTSEGLLILSKERSYLSVSIEPKNNQMINMITLNYKDSHGEKLIQSVEDSYFYITDLYNYNEYFNYRKITNGECSFYIEIEYENGKENIDLNIIKQYENKKIFFEKIKPISEERNPSSIEDIIIPDKILQEFEREEYTYTYRENRGDYNVSMSFVSTVGVFAVHEEYDGYINNYEYIINTNRLYFYKDEIGSHEHIYPSLVNEIDDQEIYTRFFNEYYNKYFKQ